MKIPLDITRSQIMYVTLSNFYIGGNEGVANFVMNTSSKNLDCGTFLKKHVKN